MHLKLVLCESLSVFRMFHQEKEATREATDLQMINLRQLSKHFPVTFQQETNYCSEHFGGAGCSIAARDASAHMPPSGVM
jgi:hypothetical protein